MNEHFASPLEGKAIPEIARAAAQAEKASANAEGKASFQPAPGGQVGPKVYSAQVQRELEAFKLVSVPDDLAPPYMKRADAARSQAGRPTIVLKSRQIGATFAAGGAQ